MLTLQLGSSEWAATITKFLNPRLSNYCFLFKFYKMIQSKVLSRFKKKNNTSFHLKLHELALEIA